MSTPAADRAHQLDTETRHDAALLYANGDSRGAVNVLIQRVNGTIGHCSPRIWVMLLDLYRILGQQAPYEKLAVFFSNRFSLSPPAWEAFDNPNKSKPAQGLGRNSLIIEGSPLTVHEEKVRDFIRASKEAGHSRLDLSRMRIDKASKNAGEELDALLQIMQRLRRLKVPTLLMGDTELLKMVQGKIQSSNNFEEDKIYWFVLFELYQWRGEEERFEELVDVFARQFEYCPVGYHPDDAIATTPTTEDTSAADDEQQVNFDEVISDPNALLQYLEQQLQESSKAKANLAQVKRITADSAREMAAFLQAQSDGQDQHSTDHKVVLDHVSEPLASLFEVTGVSAYADIKHLHAKLLSLLQSAG